MLADAHLHLALLDGEDPQVLLRESRDAGVGCFVTAGADLTSSEADVSSLPAYGADVWAVIGQHPWWADTFSRQMLDDFRRLADTERVIGIGEVGLDFVRCIHPEALQMEVFTAMLDLAEERGLPLVLHGDQLDAATHRRVIGEVKSRPRLTGMVHGFDAGREIADEWIDLGFSLCVGGVITWPDRGELRALLADLPIERLLAETDTPANYQPADARDAPNHPRNVARTIAEIARIKGMPTELVSARIVDNLARLFPRLGAARPGERALA